MLANEPWSGHYYVDGTVYMHAHWTQFCAIGWKILCVRMLLLLVLLGWCVCVLVRVALL